MRKGVSPVVAIVLLIAIAVISAVAVWSWVGPLTSKPPMGATTQYSLSFVKCYADTEKLDIKNSGGTLISSQNFSLVNASTGDTLSTSAFAWLVTLSPGEVTQMNVTINLISGVAYELRAANFPPLKFTC